MLDTAVLKAFVYDLLTTVITLVAAWLSSTENVEKLGVNPTVAPIVVALVGALVIALRRYRIIKNS